MIIFTDGSCRTNKVGGWAFYALVNGKRRTYQKLGRLENTTSNRAELHAIIEAIKYAGRRAAIIYTDSKYAANGINYDLEVWKENEWKSKSGAVIANHDLWEEVELVLSKAKLIKVCWTTFKDSGSPHYTYHRLVDKLSKIAFKSESNDDEDLFYL